MKDKIFEILQRGYGIESKNHLISDWIVEIMQEFIEWLMCYGNYEAIYDNKSSKVLFQIPNKDRIPDNLLTLNELFEYWQTNIKDK